MVVSKTIGESSILSTCATKPAEMCARVGGSVPIRSKPQSPNKYTRCGCKVRTANRMCRWKFGGTSVFKPPFFRTSYIPNILIPNTKHQNIKAVSAIGHNKSPIHQASGFLLFGLDTSYRVYAHHQNINL